jgi:hypothetical protein
VQKNLRGSILKLMYMQKKKLKLMYLPNILNRIST